MLRGLLLSAAVRSLTSPGVTLSPSALLIAAPGFSLRLFFTASDVMLNLRCGRRSKSYYRTTIYLVYNRAYASVFRAEVMTPLRNTVRLVNGIKRDGNCFKEFNIFFFGERFRCHIKQLGLTLYYIALDLIDCSFIERGVQEMGHIVILTEIAHGIDLIFHQCN